MKKKATHPPGVFDAKVTKVTKDSMTFKTDHGELTVKRLTKIKPKLSRTLSRRTKLTPDQLARVKGQAGEGQASRYRADGTQSIELTRRLAKAYRKAKRFVLYSDQIGRRVFVSADTKLAWPLTFDKKEALKFIEGFDDPGTKVQYWNEFFIAQPLKFKTTHS